MGEQLPLELVHEPLMGEEDFLVSDSNREAMEWIWRWPDWPGPALVLVGPGGCGKTHIGNVWRKRTKDAGLIKIRSDQGIPDSPVVSRCFVDDIDFAGPETDEKILHLYNLVSLQGGHLLFTARMPPARWKNRLPDLVSRLTAAPNVRIYEPNEALLSAVIVKLFADRNLDIEERVVTYISVRIERSLEVARDLVRDIDRASLARRRRVTLPLVNEVLEERRRRGRMDSASSV